MKYLEQTYKDLTLFLLSSLKDLENFTIIASEEVSDESVSVNFGVLSESHFVGITTKNKNFTEVFACTDIIIPNTSKFTFSDLENKTISSNIECFNHSFTTTTHDMEYLDAKLSNLHKLKSRKNTKFLTINFPSAKEGEVHAITEIFVTLAKNQLEIKSIHTYPNEGTFVLTSSMINY